MPRKKKAVQSQLPPLLFVSSPLFQPVPVLTPDLAVDNPVTARAVPVENQIDNSWVSPQFRCCPSGLSKCQNFHQNHHHQLSQILTRARHKSDENAGYTCLRKLQFKPLQFLNDNLSDARKSNASSTSVASVDMDNIVVDTPKIMQQHVIDSGHTNHGTHRAVIDSGHTNHGTHRAVIDSGHTNHGTHRAVIDSGHTNHGTHHAVIDSGHTNHGTHRAVIDSRHTNHGTHRAVIDSGHANHGTHCAVIDSGHTNHSTHRAVIDSGHTNHSTHHAVIDSGHTNHSTHHAVIDSGHTNHGTHRAVIDSGHTNHGTHRAVTDSGYANHGTHHAVIDSEHTNHGTHCAVIDSGHTNHSTHHAVIDSGHTNHSTHRAVIDSGHTNHSTHRAVIDSEHTNYGTQKMQVTPTRVLRKGNMCIHTVLEPVNLFKEGNVDNLHNPNKECSINNSVHILKVLENCNMLGENVPNTSSNAASGHPMKKNLTTGMANQIACFISRTPQGVERQSVVMAVDTPECDYALTFRQRQLKYR